MSNNSEQMQVGNVPPEEMQWVKECMNNKLFNYLIPIGLSTVAVMSAASMRGYRLGILARVGLISSAYVASRLATIGPCLDAAELQFPDGYIVATRRGEKAPSHFVSEFPPASESQDQMPSMDYNTTSRVPQVAPQQSALPTPPASQQTYDDLRRRNREQYTSRRTAPSPATAPRDPSAGLYSPQQTPRPDEAPYDSQYSQPISSSYSDPPSPYAENTHLSSAHLDDEIPSKIRRRRVNVYGDEIED